MIVDTIGNRQNVDVDLKCDQVILNVNQAIPLSLIANEVITNAYKHAFPENRSGEITVTLKEINNRVDLIISDNGFGLPDTFEEKKTTSLGIKLIDVLSQQMGTTYDFNRAKAGGTTFQISIQKSHVKGIGNAYLNG
jgi:two-component sensor histidine kinase